MCVRCTMGLEGVPHYGGAGGGVVEAAGRQVAEVAAETSAKNSSVDNVLGTSKCRRLCPRVCVCFCERVSVSVFLCIFCIFVGAKVERRDCHVCRQLAMQMPKSCCRCCCCCCWLQNRQQPLLLLQQQHSWLN